MARPVRPAFETVTRGFRQLQVRARMLTSPGAFAK
jgi:hypothetical protein